MQEMLLLRIHSPNHPPAHPQQPENLLLEEKDCDLKIKLADFGAACRLPNSPTHPPTLLAYVGTPGYTAPEILNARKYGEKVDCWSAGVIAYILLGGTVGGLGGWVGWIEENEAVRMSYCKL